MEKQKIKNNIEALKLKLPKIPKGASLEIDKEERTILSEIREKTNKAKAEARQAYDTRLKEIAELNKRYTEQTEAYISTKREELQLAEQTVIDITKKIEEEQAKLTIIEKKEKEAKLKEEQERLQKEEQERLEAEKIEELKRQQEETKKIIASTPKIKF